MTNTAPATPAIFNFNELPVTIFSDEHGEPWFLANDVCAILGYRNPSKTINDHCKTKGITKRYIGVVTGTKADGEPAMQQVQATFISEGNLFRLIVKSHKPEAEKFEELVMDEILPTIRKTGKYDAGQPAETTNRVIFSPKYDFTGRPGYNWVQPPFVRSKGQRHYTSSVALASYLSCTHEEVIELIRHLQRTLKAMYREDFFYLHFDEELVRLHDHNDQPYEKMEYQITRDGLSMLSRNFSGEFGLLCFMEHIHEFKEEQNSSKEYLIAEQREIITQLEQQIATNKALPPPEKEPKRKTAKYHYPKASLRPAAEHTKSWLTARTLLEDCPKPLYSLLRELERDGHNVEGAKLEYEGLHRLARSIIETSQSLAVNAKEMLELGMPVAWGGSPQRLAP